MDKKILEQEINQIKNKNLKNLIEKVICATPDWYSKMPSSTSGRFHPIDELGPGGKIIHHKKIFRLADQAAERYEIKEYEYELLKTACLIHDMPFCFNWDNDKKCYRTDRLHPFKNAFFCSKHCTDMILVSAIYFHMGIWADYKSEEAKILSLDKYKDHPVVRATQECDFYSSRRMILVLPNWY